MHKKRINAQGYKFYLVWRLQYLGFLHRHTHTHTYIDTHVHVHSFFLMHRFFVDRYALIFYSKFAHALKTQFQKEITVYPNMADKHIIPQNP